MPGSWLSKKKSRESNRKNHRKRENDYGTTVSDYSSHSLTDSDVSKGRKSNQWNHGQKMIIVGAVAIMTTVIIWIITKVKSNQKSKTVRESWVTRPPSDMQDPDDLDMIEFPPIPADVYKDHIRSLLRQSSQLLDKANQDKNPVFRVMHTSQAIAYAHALQKIANPETIQHVGNANLNEFIQVLEDAQTKAVQDLFMEAPDLQSNIPYSITTGWSQK